MVGGESETSTPRRVFATIAMIGVVVYAVVDIVLQFLPPHYSPIVDAESDLAVGPYGWIMAINFFGRGITSASAIALILLTAPRTRLRTTGVSLFAVAGLCSAVIAFFPTDIPASSGQRIQPTSLHGVIHLVGASTGFVFALAAFWILTFWVPTFWVPTFWMRDRRTAWPRVFLTIASAGLVFLAVTIVATPALLGLAERICLAGILGWVFVVAWRLRKGQSPANTN